MYYIFTTNKMDINSITFKDLPSAYLEEAKRYAQAKANSEMLEESKKSVIATDASTYEGSEALRERKARSSQSYKDYLKIAQQAKQTELELRHTLIALTMKFDYCRAMQSTERAKMNLI